MGFDHLPTDQARARTTEQRPIPPSVPNLVVQAKLRVGAADDPYEREADHLADKVLRRLRRVSGDPAEVTEHVSPVAPTTRIARSTAPLGVEVGPAGGELGDELSGRIRRASGSGTALAGPTRSRMEAAFGADLGDVRVHVNSDVAPRIGATAFTTGNHIHFAPGEYDPSGRAGQWTLGHELAHVMQQTGPRMLTGDETVHRSVGGVDIQRHSSFEHMLIGDLSPTELATIGASFDVAAGAKKVSLGKNERGEEVNVDKTDVMHVIQQEIKRLKIFQTNPPVADTAQDIAKREAELKAVDPTWDVRLVSVANASERKFLVTYGEMNTLADFFGNPEELYNMDVTFVDKLIRSVRRSTLRELVKVYAEVTKKQSDWLGFTPLGKNSEEKAAAELGLVHTDFKNAKGESDAFELVGIAAELALMGINPKGTAKPTVGGEKATDYSSTLARNACHFAPESWHAWADYHEKALEIAGKAYMQNYLVGYHQEEMANATSEPDANQARVDMETAKEEAARLTNDALLMNGFGDHYLQDSYASGHLINKTLVMQWYVQWLDKSPYHSDMHLAGSWQKVQAVAYGQSGPTDLGQYKKEDVGKSRKLGDIDPGSARNPQTVENLDTDWKTKAKALGLEIPPSVTDPKSKQLLVEWQSHCLQSGGPGTVLAGSEVKTVTELVTLGKLTKDETLDALTRLVDDGIVVHGSYKTSDRQQGNTRARLVDSAKVQLRSNWIPKADKAATFAATVTDAAAYGDMALGTTYNDYLEFMNSSFLQKATNYLHDFYCKEGLQVYAGDGEEVFKIYGDNNMLQKQSSKGLAHSAETARQSRNAIIEFATVGQVTNSTQNILARVPDRVELGSGPIKLDAWHTGALRTKCEKEIFPSMSSIGFTQLSNKIAPGVSASLGKISVNPPHAGEAF